jgi:hypothetical protein
LPAVLGLASSDFKLKAWKPIIKYFRDAKNEEYNLFENFVLRFEHYLKMENTEMEPDVNMIAESKEVEWYLFY